MSPELVRAVNLQSFSSVSDAGQQRIVYVIEALGLGGAERLLVDTLRSLDRERWSPTVVALSKRHDHVAELRELGVPVFAFESRTLVEYWRTARWLVAYLRDHPATILHSHLFRANLLSRWVSTQLSPRPRLMTTLHNPDYTDDAGHGWRWHVRKSLDAWSARRVDRFVAVSDYVREDYQRHFGLSNIDVIHNGVNLDRLHSTQSEVVAVRAELGLAEDALLVLHVGRCSEQKGPLQLLKAFAQVAARHPEAHLLYVGDGPLRSELLRRVKQPALEGRVTSWKHRDDVPNILAAADVFVFPSVFEGFGLALVEAMAVELPVIATRVGGILKIVRHRVDGWLIEPNDVTGLAEAINHLLEAPAERARLGAAARERVQEAFEISNQVRCLERLYEQVLDEPTSSSTVTVEPMVST